MDLLITNKLELLLTFCGVGGQHVERNNSFVTGPFNCQIEVIEIDSENILQLVLNLPCYYDDILLRVAQSVRPESIFGVVSNIFLVNNRLILSCLLPTELVVEDWYRIFEYQKSYLLSFLSK